MSTKKSSAAEINTDSISKSIDKLPKNRKRLFVIFGLLFAAIGLWGILQAGAAPKTSAAVTLSISPSSQRIQSGSTIGLAIKLNTNGQTVNAVQANLTYPTANFEFVNIDAAGSAFDVQAESTGADGVIRIARGAITPVNSGDLLVATVYLKATAAGRRVKVAFADSSAVVRTPDAMNILQKKTGGTYTIQ